MKKFSFGEWFVRIIPYFCKNVSKNERKSMIREIRMANFMSVRDEKVLSFEATKDDTAQELLTVEVRPN